MEFITIEFNHNIEHATNVKFAELATKASKFISSKDIGEIKKIHLEWIDFCKKHCPQKVFLFKIHFKEHYGVEI